MWEAKPISFPLFEIRWLPLYPIRESWGEKRNRRTHKKKKEGGGTWIARIELNTGWNSHETRAAGWRTAAISHRGRDPRFHGSCTGQETRHRRLARTGPTFCITGTEAAVRLRSPPLFLPPLNAESGRNNETREPAAIEYKTDTERGGTRSGRDKQKTCTLLFTLLSKVGREVPPTRNERILN